jgi:hypothetical protein
LRLGEILNAIANAIAQCSKSLKGDDASLGSFGWSFPECLQRAEICIRNDGSLRNTVSLDDDLIFSCPDRFQQGIPAALNFIERQGLGHCLVLLFTSCPQSYTVCDKRYARLFLEL